MQLVINNFKGVGGSQIAASLLKIMEHYKNKNLETLVEEVNGVVYVEEWKDILGYEGDYQVSSFGRIKSFRVSKSGRIRKGVPALGYLQVQLKVDKVLETKKVHRLVAQHFIPNPENKPEVNHEFGVKTDNMVWVLKWATASENAEHAYRVLGKKNNLVNQKGETHYNTKYKNEDILKIRELYSTGEYTKAELANMYSDKPTNIHRIISKQRWAHI